MEKLQTGDSVVMIAGKDKGAKSTIESIHGDWVVVKGVNMQRKGVKGEGLIQQEAPVHRSNLAHRDEKSEAPSRVGVKKGKNGNERYYKKSGEAIA